MRGSRSEQILEPHARDEQEVPAVNAALLGIAIVRSAVTLPYFRGCFKHIELPQ